MSPHMIEDFGGFGDETMNNTEAFTSAIEAIRAPMVVCSDCMHA